MKAGDKYKVDPNQDEQEVLPNKLGLRYKAEVEREEAKGFVEASVNLSLDLSQSTVFDSKYILQIHKAALNHLYGFAGELRTVNISKSGFYFPTAQFLPNAMVEFDNMILNHLPLNYNSKDELIKYVAMVHGELLYIHPFRECNGRTARLLANLMVYKAGYDRLKFEKLDNEEKFGMYIQAIQKVGLKQYQPMIDIISDLF